ncbi:uncharacterized protein LOC141679888 [Apium graveolens]|uniref:uncharacterized protein LOC141679888 n=1 Tax=Apium graveolens TaxID=4045 RepID=UPI003D7C1077
MKDSEHIDNFCMRLTGLVTKIRSLGEVIGEEYVVKKLLRAVPTRFLQILSELEQFGNLETMTVEEVTGALKSYEERLQGQEESSQGHHQLLRSGKNNSVGGSDYRVRDNRVVRDRSTIKCFICGSYGHFVIEYRKLRKVKQQKGEVNLTQLNDEEPALLMVMCERDANDIIRLTEDKKPMNKKEMEKNIWYLDNGASNHMTGHREKFVKLDGIEKGEVRFSDGSLVKIEGKGSIRFACKNGETKELHGVHYIRTLRSNIISLGELTEEENRVEINYDSLWVFDNYGNLLMHVKRSGN